MPQFCAVLRCANRGKRDNVKFFRIPAILNFRHRVDINQLSAERQKKWLNVIKRGDLHAGKLKHARVCSRHFISGKPAALEDTLNPDWAPSVNMGYGDTTNATSSMTKVRRHHGKVEMSNIETEPTESKYAVVKINSECNDSTNVSLVEEFDQICRCCLSTEKEVCSIFELRYNENNFSDLLHSCTSIHVKKNDRLPENICYDCIKKVIEFYEFKSQCSSSESTLKHALLKNDRLWNKGNETEEIIIIQQDDKESILLDEDRECYDDINAKIFEDDNKRKDIQCDVCFLNFDHKGNLDLHMKFHSGDKPHKCDLCEKAFIRATALKIHMRTHMEKSEKIYFCNLCDKIFEKLRGYRSHLFTVHAIGPDPDKKTKCDICQKMFSTLWTMRAHQEQIHGEKKFLCSECGKSCSSLSVLKIHQRVHTGEKPYRCSTCSKLFAHYSSLKTHIFCHTGEKPYVCSICKRGFTQRRHMKLHLRTHTGEKPFVCTFCSKSFAQKMNLTVHVRTHTGETPYICDVCGKGFYDSSTMKNHKKSHSVDNNN